MIRWLKLGALALLFPAMAAQAQDVDPRPFQQAERVSTSRILNGYPAQPGSFPETLQITAIARQTDGTARADTVCGATLIASDWALTAAHCLVELTQTTEPRSAPRMLTAVQDIAILGGSVNRGDGQKVHVVQVVPHPKFVQGDPGYDIGLVRLDPPLTDKVSITDLVSMALAPIVLMPRPKGGTVIGWGSMVPPGAAGFPLQPVSLMQVDVDLLGPTPSACPPGQAGSGQFCASGTSACVLGGYCPDACTGDSGGPLFVRYGQARLQAGIVSRGKGCGDLDSPGVYTSVGLFEDWIRGYVPAASFRQPDPPAFAQTGELLAPLLKPPLPDSPGLVPYVSVSLLTPASIPVGNAMQFGIVSNVKGRLLIFNQNTDGSGYLIFPNHDSRAATLGALRERIAPGDYVRLPQSGMDQFWIRAEPPAGRNRIVALVVPGNNSKLDAAIAPYLDQRHITALRGWIAQLAATLPAGRVATGSADYEILR